MIFLCILSAISFKVAPEPKASSIIKTFFVSLGPDETKIVSLAFVILSFILLKLF